MPAVPTHHTETSSRAWDGPTQVKNLKTPLTVAIGNKVFAYRDSGADPATKAAWSYVHHFVDGTGQPGAASIKGCQSAVGYLNGAGGNGTGVPEADRRAVYDHLAAHLRDAKVDVPELKSNRGPRSGLAAVRNGYRGTPEQRVLRREVEWREIPDGTGGTLLRLTGFASVTGESSSYEMEDHFGPWVESIDPNAFDKTLSEGADVAFLVNHTGMTLARTKSATLKLSAIKDGRSSPIPGVTGLHYEALLDPQNMYVQAIRSAVERGDLDECSFAFRVMRQQWNGDYDRRRILEVSIDKGDVSLCNFGANPHTGGTVGIRQRGLYPDRLIAIDGRSDVVARRALERSRTATDLARLKIAKAA